MQITPWTKPEDMYNSKPQDILIKSYQCNGTPLQCSCLKNPMDGGAWWAAVHGVTKSQTRLNDFTFTFHFHALEKKIATHSSVLAWRIPGMGEPGGLPSMGSHRVGHDWSDLAAAAVQWHPEHENHRGGPAGWREGRSAPHHHLVTRWKQTHQAGKVPLEL